MNATYAVRTPPGAGAIAAIDLLGDLPAAFAALGVAPVAIGHVRLRDLCAVDMGVVARWDERRCTLMPHGGVAVVRALCAALDARGVTRAEPAPLDAFPEAADEAEALALRALATAESPRAVDLLLDQPRRWRAWRGQPPESALRENARALSRLLRAPIVAAIGPTNIGKSTLLNALARREVSIAHDAPGVTRDHVGASLVVDGLTVRWLDTPGLRVAGDADDLERESIARALSAAGAADLLVLCADAGTDWPAPGATLPQTLSAVPTLRVALRADLGVKPGADVAVAAAKGVGLDDLAAAVRGALVPDAALADPAPWLFDDDLPATLSFPTVSPRNHPGR